MTDYVTKSELKLELEAFGTMLAQSITNAVVDQVMVQTGALVADLAQHIHNELVPIKADISGLKTDVRQLKLDVNQLKKDMKAVKKDNIVQQATNDKILHVLIDNKTIYKALRT